MKDSQVGCFKVRGPTLRVRGPRWSPASRADALRSDAASRGSREALEVFFATNAMTFVVGWSWVVLARDLSTLAAAALARALHASLWARHALAAIAAFACGPAIGLAIGCRARDGRR